MAKRKPRGSFANVLRQGKLYKNWQEEVFFKDRFKCTECGYKPKDVRELEAHHIYAFENLVRDFLRENSKYDLETDRTTLLSLAYIHSPLWELNNGKTLCKPCHDKLDNKGITSEL